MLWPRGAGYEAVGGDVDDAPRRWPLLRVGFLATVATVFVFRGSGVHRSVVFDGLDESGGDEASPCAAEGLGDDYVVCTWAGSAFLEVASIRAHFAARNVSDAEATRAYLPATFSARFSPKRLGGDVDFKVAFALYLPEASRNMHASYVVVAAADGRVAAAAATTDLDDGPRSTHFDAVKLASPETVLAYSNVWDEEAGRPYVWAFGDPTARPRRLNDVVSRAGKG